MGGRGARIAAALMLAAALGPTSRGALAQAGEPGETLLLFSATDLWRQGGFGHGGLLWAPDGLDRTGPVVKLMFGGGAYRYVSGALGGAIVRGDLLSTAILPGWRFVRDKLTVTGFIGADFQNHKLSPDDPSTGLRGGYAGARAGFDLWYEPTPATMLAADASVSSIGPSYSARLAFGWRAFDRFYIGPEVQGFDADSNYRQFRAGLHLTGLRTGDLEWSTGFGWATDTDNRSGAYGKLGVFTRR